MDLSKVLDSFNHELLIAKLKGYGLDQHEVEVFRSYFSKCYQCCKINNTLGDWRKIIDSRCTTVIYTGSFIVQHIFK